VNVVNTTPATPELAALKNGDLDGFVLWSPIIDRAVIDGYGYFPRAATSEPLRSSELGTSCLQPTTSS
jgi:ABC-type nitrate/sulfonate/bicarbonate transport system substrate-binding protein